MNYSVDKLVSIQDCSTLQAMVNKEKSSLEFKKLSLERSHDNYLTRSTQIATDIAVGESELTALNTILAGLPEGEAKDDNVVRKTKLEYRLFTLNEQNDNYGVGALLEKEMEISLTGKQLEEIDVFSQAIEARKNELN